MRSALISGKRRGWMSRKQTNLGCFLFSLSPCVCVLDRGVRLCLLCEAAFVLAPTLLHLLFLKETAKK